MQKNGVKAISIIDTLSELAQHGQQGDVVAAPSAVSSPAARPYYHYPLNSPPVQTNGHKPERREAPPPPSLQPRSPKVVNIVPSPPKVRHRSHVAATSNGVVGVPLATSSAVNLAESSLLLNNSAASGGGSMNLSAISSPGGRPLVVNGGAKSKQPRNGPVPVPPPLMAAVPTTSTSSRGQTPDWIRDIFLNAKRGIIDKLVS